MNTAAHRTKILIVDKHPVVLDGLVAGIKKYPRLEIVAATTNFQTAKKYLDGQQINLLTTELSLSHHLEGKKLLQAAMKNPQCRVAVLSFSQIDDGGNPTRIVPDACLFQNLDQAAAALIAPAKSKLPVDKKTQAWQTLPPESAAGELEAKEWRLLKLLCRGASNQEIANELAYSSRSIRRRSSAIFKKIGVKGRIGAIVWATRNTLAEEVVRDVPKHRKQPVVTADDLTLKEHGILKLMADEVNDVEIARELSYSLRSVRRYNTSIYKKLGVNSRIEAVIKALEDGLLD